MHKRLSVAVAVLVIAALFAGDPCAAGCKVTMPLDGRTARTAESTLGDLVADAARAALGADVALIQASQLRLDSIPAGELSEECIRAVLLYPDEPLVLTRVPGSKIREALERSLSALPQPNPGFLQVSGLVVSYRQNSPEQGRVVSAAVGGQELSPAKTYLVAMPSSLAKGQMGYFRVFDDLKVEPGSQSPSLIDATARYVRGRNTISITPGKRLVNLAKTG